MLHIGLDMHKRFSKIAVIDDGGRLLERRTLHHDNPDDIREYFRSIGRDGTVTLEATRSWYWLYELLEAEGLRVKLANPLRVRLIAEAQIKTDEIDALILAQLERIGYLPESYTSPETHFRIGSGSAPALAMTATTTLLAVLLSGP